jgi:branched-chain amino acid transport system permease protein
MVTLGFTILFFQVAKNESEITGGVTGLRDIPRPRIFGHALENDNEYFYVIAGTLLLASFAYHWLVSSRWGRAFEAMRENEMRAEALGVNLRNYKTMAFAIGAAYAGAAGALLAPLLRYIDPTPFTLDRSLQFLIMVVVGGPGWLAGPFVGAVIVTLLPELLRGAQSLYMMVFALMLILMLLFAPRGIVPYVVLGVRSLKSFRRGKPADAQPDTPTQRTEVRNP